MMSLIENMDEDLKRQVFEERKELHLLKKDCLANSEAV